MMSIYPIARIQLLLVQFSILCYKFCILAKPACMSIWYNFGRDHGSSGFRKPVVNKWIFRKNCGCFLKQISSLAVNSIDCSNISALDRFLNNLSMMVRLWCLMILLDGLRNCWWILGYHLLFCMVVYVQETNSVEFVVILTEKSNIYIYIHITCIANSNICIYIIYKFKYICIYIIMCICEHQF